MADDAHADDPFERDWPVLDHEPTRSSPTPPPVKSRSLSSGEWSGLALSLIQLLITGALIIWLPTFIQTLVIIGLVIIPIGYMLWHFRQLPRNRDDCFAALDWLRQGALVVVIMVGMGIWHTLRFMVLFIGAAIGVGWAERRQHPSSFTSSPPDATGVQPARSTRHLEHVQCPRCSGQGRATCERCQGSGYDSWDICPRCRKSGLARCQVCDGTGSVERWV